MLRVYFSFVLLLSPQWSSAHTEAELCLLRAMEAISKRKDLADDPDVNALTDAAEGLRLETYQSKFVPEVGGAKALERGYEDLAKWVNNQRGGNVGIIHFDLDGLKFVNETGHNQGDLFIETAVRALHEATQKAGLRINDQALVFHPSGDELVVLVKVPGQEPGQVAKVAQKIHHYFSQQSHPAISQWGQTLKDGSQLAARIEGPLDQRHVVESFQAGRLSATAAYGEVQPVQGSVALEEILEFSKMIDRRTTEAKKTDGNRGKLHSLPMRN